MKKLKIFGVIILSILILLGIAFLYMYNAYKVTQVDVDGNIHYTNKQIEEIVINKGLDNNSFFLAVKYKFKKIQDVPFVEKIEVEKVSNHRICIHVYEKRLAGCVNYLGNYMYFDRNGIVVESSSELTEGIPQIRGLSFDHVVLHEKLPVEDDTIFGEILKVTQLLEKYELTADKIYFSSNKEITLISGQTQIRLGKEDNLNEKIMELKEIIPNLDGQAGTLYMEDYDMNTTTIHFEPNQQ